MNKLWKNRLMENDGLARFPRIVMNMQIIQSGFGNMTSRGETRPENSWVKRTGVPSVIMNAHHQLNLRTKVALWGISWVCMTIDHIEVSHPVAHQWMAWAKSEWSEPTGKVIMLLKSASSHRSLGDCNPTGNLQMSRLVWTWLCWVAIHPWKCYQQYLRIFFFL